MVSLDSQYLNSEQIQYEELCILREFGSFCDDRSLSYSLAGGTLLGAVRHKGFIPWDDDIDVCMPRPDYERFVELFPLFAQRTGFRLEGYAGIESNPLFYKVVNPRIAVLDAADKPNSDNHLWIDVFPYDGLPSGDDEIARIYREASRLRNIVWLNQTRWTYSGTLAKRAAKTLLGAAVKLTHWDHVCSRRLYELATAIPYGSTDTVGCITWGMYGAGEAIPFEGFEKRVQLEFCGEEYPAFSCWDKYLSGIYGDYMTPPPPDKRIAHGLKAWRV